MGRVYPNPERDPNLKNFSKPEKSEPKKIENFKPKPDKTQNLKKS